jgi:ABC-type transport system involved in cytochrome c biogenesis permease component
MTPPLATSTFLQVMFALMIVVPICILWVAAVVDVIRRGGNGLKIAGVLLGILIFPILGPLLWFVIRPESATPEEIEAQVMAQADLRRERSSAPIGSSGVH